MSKLFLLLALGAHVALVMSGSGPLIIEKTETYSSSEGSYEVTEETEETEQEAFFTDEWNEGEGEGDGDEASFTDEWKEGDGDEAFYPDECEEGEGQEEGDAECDYRPNEKYYECPDSVCNPQYCYEVGFQRNCPEIKPGCCSKSPGCYCTEGYVRDDTGKCIDASLCPSCGGDENAQRGCGSNCGRLCSNYNSTKPILCPLSCILDGCDCKKGFVFDQNIGRCVEPKQCTAICTKPNTVFSPCSTSSCYTVKTCKDLDTSNGTLICPNVTTCIPGCICKDDYLLDCEGNCIPENECPNSKCKGAHETYVQRPDSQCGPKSCSEVGIPETNSCLIDDGKTPQKPRCLCKNSYVYDSKGVCIPINDCPSCGPNGDKNATSGCGNLCGPRCSNYWKRDTIVCPLFCRLNSCTCKEGYVYDDNTQQCVLSQDCTKVCGQDEQYSTCANGGCWKARKCSEFKDEDEYNKLPLKCARPSQCIPDCICKDGYVRNKNGVCVLPKDCTANKQCKGDHEFYDSCTPPCSSEKCSDLRRYIDNCIIPPDGTNKCVGSCRCAQGYYRDKSGKCILEQQCPKNCPPQCPTDEEYSYCVNGGCYGPRTCATRGGPTICVDLIPGGCRGGCKCRDGFLRNEYGKCVPEYECPPPTCPKDEVWDDCVNGNCDGPKTCTELLDRGNTTICIKLAPGTCKGGCKCKGDWVRNENGDCVPQNQCPKKCTGENEQWVSCPNPCDTNTCDSIGKEIHCPLEKTQKCKGQCKCKAGYYRNIIGVCVSKTDCLKCTKPHEFYACGGACDNICSHLSRYNQTNCPIINVKCNEMCYCEPGYARDGSGNCVPISECRSCPGEHEWWDKCAPTCPPNTCKTFGRIYDCPPPPKGCKGACRCEDDYSRNDKGVCIPRKDCPCGDDPNAVIGGGCGVPCDRYCSTYNSSEPIACTEECKLECDCKPGYVYDDIAKRCTLPKKCTPVKKCNGENEQWESCPNPCDTNTCDSIGKKIHCPLEKTKKCKGQCKCKPGFYRNIIGHCVSKADCLKCTKPHEYYACGGACDNICSRLGQYNQSNCPFINVKCNEMCYCKPGYARDGSGNCVPISECRSCPGEHEWWDKCAPTCPPNTCNAFGKVYHCPLSLIPPKGCKGACRCEDDYSRNDKGVCILRKNCPCGDDPNAVIGGGCGVPCDRYCSTYNSSKLIACAAVCKNECDCKPGYVYDEVAKKCTLPEKCIPVCGNGGYFNHCPRTQPCDADYCAKSRTDPSTCPSTKKCGTPRCTCGVNQKMNRKTGKCDSVHKCPPFPCGKNEVYDGSCPPLCVKENCKNYLNNDTTCKPVGFGVVLPCLQRCLCKKGYYRNSKGECVEPKQCKKPLPTCGKNEIYNACPPLCIKENCTDYLNNDTKCHVTGKILTKIPCRPKCLCKKGYFRNSKGECVEAKQCKTCPKDEVWDDCINGRCQGPHTCTELADRGNTTICYKISESDCKGGCKCKKDWVRNKNGVCVPQNQCPIPICKNGGIWNTCPPQPCDAENCPKSRNDPSACRSTRNCGTPRCTCGFNQKLDRKTHKCINIKDCPPFPCSKNEIYNPCPPLCIKENCTNYLNNDTTCRYIGRIGIVLPCSPKCLCKKGYFRNSKGECIEAKQCKTCPTNEVWDDCVNGGCQGPRNCTELANRGNTTICFNLTPGSCKGGCKCKKDWVRNKNGVCVPQNQCPNRCKINEVYQICQNLCPYDECSVNPALIRCASPPTPGDPKCKPGCRCLDGYARNNARICVPRDQCPNDKCTGQNEQWYPCASSCDHNTCESIGKKIHCAPQKLQICRGQCKCKPGFYRNIIGLCVSKADCLKCTKPHEYYACGGACDNICSRLGQYNQSNCPFINVKCNEMCYCEPGYARDGSGNCVPISECRSCPGKHEWSDKCAPTCPPNTCRAFGKVFPCPRPIGCKRACRCEDDYSRDDNGICIPRKDCPCGKDPNAVIGGGCGVPCNRYCSTYNSSKPIACTAECKKECDCKPGYVFDDIAKICTRPEKCTPQCGKNSHYSTCIQGECRPLFCADRGKLLPCPSVRPGFCIKGCVCNKGYLKDKQGNCVPEGKCPCENGGTWNPCPPQPCDAEHCPKSRNDPTVCKSTKNCGTPRCTCGLNQRLDRKTGKCIPIKDCPPFPCGKNEMYNPCPLLCNKENCTNYLNKDTTCHYIGKIGIVLPCSPKCLCKMGYYRNSKGECVEAKQCKTCPKDEVWDDCINGRCQGPHTCTELANRGNTTICYKISESDCKGGCKCKKDWVRNEKGVCVPQYKCPCNTCGQNEEYNPCPGRCPLRRCGFNDRTVFCPKQPVVGDKDCLPPTCTCKPGYYRNSQGKCVKWEQCSKCSINEVFDHCSPGCPPRVCGINPAAVSCLPVSESPCVAECRCKDGFLRNDYGQCVAEADCPPPPDQMKCTKPNEYYACGGPCDNICSRLGQYNQTICHIVNKKCNDMCYCKPGYARDGSGDCVPISECRNCTGKHEWWDKCAPNCPPDTCSSFGKKYNCPLSLIPPGGCHGACRCEDDYSRDANGICIPKKDCPCGDGSDPNAVIGGGCGVPCDRYCSTYNSSEPIACTDECKNECDCKPGYVYDDIAKRCTLPEKCTPKSCPGNGEEVSTCVEALCRQQECSKKGDPVACPDLLPGSCSSGCVCKKGYLRNASGTCILEDKCPITACPSDSEVLSNCVEGFCSQQECAKKGEPFPCPDVWPERCTTGCLCISGYLRNINGTCIPEDQCPPKPCGDNGRYSTCIQAECRSLTCADRGKSLPCPKVKPGFCKKGCVCNEGYLKNEEGSCILEENCPCENGGTWDTCPSQPCEADYCPKCRTDPSACRSTKNCGTPRCTCGFNDKLDRKTGKCIPITECPPFPCGKNEVYNACPVSLCIKENCTNYLNNDTKCHIIGKIGVVVQCSPKCLCKKGYFRNSKGDCVEAKQCKSDNSTTGPGSNDTCNTGTPGETTADQLKLKQAINQFSFEFFKRVAASKPGENLIMSPFSVALPFYQLMLYSKGETLNQLQTTLHVDSIDQLRRAIRFLLQAMKGSEGVVLDKANKVYVNNLFKISKPFLSDTTCLFNATAEPIDCSQPATTAGKINKFVADNTDNKITNLIPQDAINELVRIILVNAIYFKGTWKIQFDKEQTKKHDFYTSDNKTMQVPMMYMETRLNYTYSAELKAKIVVLYYVNPQFKYFLALPDEKNGLPDLINKIDATVIDNLLSSVHATKIKLWMPSFKTNLDLDLNEILVPMGMEDIFSSKAKLSGVLEKNEPISVSKGIHMAFMEVNEEGTTAAAATGIIVGTTAVGGPRPIIPEVKCDHPFFMMLFDGTTAIFTGTYQKVQKD